MRDGDQTERDGTIDRRHFARQLAFGAAALTSTLAAIPAVNAEIPPAPKLPEDLPPAVSEKGVPPEAPPPEVLLLTYLVRRYPSERFDDAALQGIFRDIRGDMARGQVLTEFPLKNSDEPAFVFSAYRGPDGMPLIH